LIAKGIACDQDVILGAKEINWLEEVRRWIVEEIQDGRHGDKLLGMAKNEYDKAIKKIVNS
jgi:hypothetical protein